MRSQVRIANTYNLQIRTLGCWGSISMLPFTVTCLWSLPLCCYYLLCIAPISGNRNMLWIPFTFQSNHHGSLHTQYQDHLHQRDALHGQIPKDRTWQVDCISRSALKTGDGPTETEVVREHIYMAFGLDNASCGLSRQMRKTRWRL